MIPSEKQPIGEDDLFLLVQELKSVIQDNQNANDILCANLDEWTDIMAQNMTTRFFDSVKPYILNQYRFIQEIKKELQKLVDKVGKYESLIGHWSIMITISVFINIATMIFIIIVFVQRRGS